MNSKCRRCGSKTVLDDTDIEKMKEQVRSMRGARLVPDEEYERRLDICRGCDRFEYGSTCTICGCVMQVRAMLSDGKCPYPRKSKW